MKNNIKEITLNSYEEFEKIVLSLIENKQANSSKILFRGQADFRWKLQPTLERIKDNFSVNEYYEILKSIKSELESFTNMIWILEDKSNNGIFIPPSGYKFMSYLRHIGFPTPILDWTRNPYVALFFAYVDNVDSEHVSIYVYQEYQSSENRKGGLDSFPYIVNLPNEFESHKRHKLQESEYTICRIMNKDTQYYTSHEIAFRNNLQGHDMCIKYLLPTNERKKILQILENKHINSYTLFGSEESLAKKLMIDKFDLMRQK
ncbi:MAG: FRG domain-containing protein [Arcobacteraceae bacterium]|nr:FRG domain-containing protein [Arcobacteraceae bacterium]